MLIDLTPKARMSEPMSNTLPQVIVRPKNYVQEDERDIVLDVTSHDPVGRCFSPFFLPAVGTRFQNVENAWQYHKVFTKLGHVGSDGRPNRAWRDWHEAAKKLENPVRYPAGRGASAEYSFITKRLVSYTMARKMLYIPLYAQSVARHRRDEFDTLLYRDYKAGAKILLLDFDAYATPVNDWRYMVNNPLSKFGHGFVLAMMLEHGPDFHKRIIV